MLFSFKLTYKFSYTASKELYNTNHYVKITSPKYTPSLKHNLEIYKVYNLNVEYVN